MSSRSSSSSSDSIDNITSPWSSLSEYLFPSSPLPPALRPSFFELLASDRTVPSLHAASRYLCTVIAQRARSDRALRIARLCLQWHDELFALLSLLLLELRQASLSHTGAPFTEALFGLTRRKWRAKYGAQVDSGKEEMNVGRRLSRWDRLFTALLAVALPYARRKLDQWTEQSNRTRMQGDHEEEEEEEELQQQDQVGNVDRFRRVVKRIRGVIVRVYPRLSTLWDALSFIYVLLYLFRDTAYWSPIQHIQGHILQRATPHNMVLQHRETTMGRMRTLHALHTAAYLPSPLGRLAAMAVRIGFTLADYSRHALLLLVFAVRFLEWWYQSESQLRPQQRTVVPPPPRPAKRAPGALDLPLDVSLCPICRKKRTNQSLLSVSGYVFCYACIHTYVGQHGRCPITHIPAELRHLRRIYEQ